MMTSSIEKILLQYLAPAAAKKAAKEVTGAIHAALSALLDAEKPRTAPARPQPLELSMKARKVMSFKKALYHAKNRAAKGAPEPHDALILAAAAAGKVISVEKAKRTAAKRERRQAASSDTPPTEAEALL